MSDEENQDIPMAECGACRAIIPLDSESCSNCGIRFGGVSEEELGECGACGKLQPADSASCVDCGVSFVAEETTSADEEDSVAEETVDETVDETADLEEDEGSDDDDEEEDDSDDDDEEEDDSDDDDEEEDDSDDDDEEEDDSGDDDEEEDDSDDDDEGEDASDDDGIADSAVVMAFENLALAIAESGMTAGEAFGEMDASADNLIDAPELQKGIEKIAGEKLTPKHVTAILNYLDKDGNKRIDPKELIGALEDLRIGIKPGKVPKVKTFPSPAQKFLMSKKANDIFYPIAYFLMVTFIGLWVVNGMGLLVDGTGGTVVYDGGVDQWGGEITEANWNLCQSDALEEMIDPCQGTVAVGETYPCDPALDSNKCANSLTPFSGENDASSMPAGFYGDGIFMIILGVIGLAVTAYLHLVYAPALRNKTKKGSKKSDEEEDDSDDDSDEEEEDDDEEDDSDEEEDDENDDSDEEDDDDDESDDDDDDEDDDEEDDIDVGSWVGLDIDGEEFFGEIVEFDDDEGTVTIETEDGEEVTGDQDDMFLEDEDDE